MCSLYFEQHMLHSSFCLLRLRCSLHASSAWARRLCLAIPFHGPALSIAWHSSTTHQAWPSLWELLQEFFQHLRNLFNLTELGRYVQGRLVSSDFLEICRVGKDSVRVPPSLCLTASLILQVQLFFPAEKWGHWGKQGILPHSGPLISPLDQSQGRNASVVGCPLPCSLTGLLSC